MKNIIIAGPSRAGKSTLARMIREEFHHFVINLDKLVAVFQEAYPQLDIRLNWNRDATTNNLAPFLGHFLAAFSSGDGRGLMSYSHGAAPENHFVMEGGYFNFEKILPILNRYGIGNLQEHFILIGLVQNNKSIDEFIDDFKRYDTEDDWTYNFSDDDLKDVSNDVISFSAKMTESLTKHGFTIYDTSHNREQVFRQIIEDIHKLV